MLTGLAMTLMVCGKPASPPSHSPWKTLRVSHRLTVPANGISHLTSYRGTHVWHPCLPSLGSFKNLRLCVVGSIPEEHLEPR
jgi:hypothetical protein